MRLLIASASMTQRIGVGIFWRGWKDDISHQWTFTSYLNVCGPFLRIQRLPWYIFETIRSIITIRRVLAPCRYCPFRSGSRSKTMKDRKTRNHMEFDQPKTQTNSYEKGSHKIYKCPSHLEDPQQTHDTSEPQPLLHSRPAKRNQPFILKSKLLPVQDKNILRSCPWRAKLQWQIICYQYY